MPIPVQDTLIEHVGNGVTTVFSYPFTILSSDDLKCRINGALVTTGFTVSGVGSRTGGSVTFSSAPASLASVLLYRQVSLDRETDYQENGDLLASVIDDDFDRAWMAIQDLGAFNERSLRVPVGEVLDDLPGAESRADRILGFNSLGEPIMVTRTEDGGSALALDLASTSDSSKGAGMSGYSGTLNYVAGTIGAALNEELDPKRFPWLAKADGESDDTASIQAAITACGSRLKLRCAPGDVYLISASLAIPSGFLADFGNAKIKRKPGGVFDMLTNTGGSGIRINNLIVDGNRAADGRVAANVGDRFGGIVLNSVTSSELRNVTVNNTVNAEDGRAGVYLGTCTNVDLYNVGGSGNDRSCVFISGGSFNRIFGSYTANNLGSGVTSDNANDCEYYAITAINSGYSGISINGLRSKANGLRSIGTATGYAGVNIGHDDASNRSHDSVIENVHSYSNSGWGVTVVGSDRVQLRGIYAGANASANVYVFSNSNACSIDGLTASGSTAGSGVLITSGTGHKIDNAEVHTNALHGIDVETGCGAVISSTVRSYNNGQTTGGMAGVLLNGAVGSSCYAECFDDQGSKTQGYGIWLAGGTSNMIGGYYHDNATSPVRETSSPSYSSDRIRTGANILNGSFTPAAAATSVTINNNNARSGMTVVFQPANAAGRSLGQPVLSTITAGTSFVANLGGAAVGTESYTYTIM